jgi:hypothetical protein
VPVPVQMAGGGAGIAAEFGRIPRVTAALTSQTDLPATIAVGSLTNQAMITYTVLN